MITALVLLYLLWMLLAVACAWLGFHMAKQSGRLLLRIDTLDKLLREAGLAQSRSTPGLPAGTLAADFSLPLLTGGSMKLSQWRGRVVLLIFFNPACRFCRDMLPELNAALQGHSPSVDPVTLIVSTGTIEENRRLFDAQKISCSVLIQEKFEVGTMYRADATPLPYVVDAGGLTVGDAFLGAEPIIALIRAASASSGLPTGRQGSPAKSLAGSKLKRDGLKAGTVAPDFRLPTLGGGELALSDFRGRDVLLVFSDPDCGPCNQLLPQLQKVQDNSTDLQVLMISRGDAEKNQKKVSDNGLKFPVVLQRQWEISRAYGMFATPTGFLVDQSGVLASDVAVGSDEILRLAIRQTSGVRTEQLSLASADL